FLVGQLPRINPAIRQRAAELGYAILLGRAGIADEVEPLAVMVAQHRREGDRRGMVAEISRDIADDKAALRIERARLQLPLWLFGANLIPPVFPSLLQGGKADIGYEIEYEDLSHDGVFVVRLDRQRPIEMSDRRHGITNCGRAAAEQRQRGSGMRIDLEHPVAERRRLGNVAAKQEDIGFPAEGGL